jgi:hypothetical protein
MDKVQNTTMLRILALIALASTLASASAQPGVVAMSMRRDTIKHARSLDRAKLKAKRDPFSVNLDSYINGGGFYAVNVTVGTPPQSIILDIDTGSSDIWMFGPHSCDSSTSLCYGGLYNPDTSSTVQNPCSDPNQCPPFSIQYGTPGSGVNGFYFQDTFNVGGHNVKNLTMAFATEAAYTPTGIMGIGFALGESLEGEEQTTYKNLVDVMVDQKLIPSASYSLYLDDLGKTFLHGVNCFKRYANIYFRRRARHHPFRGLRHGQVRRLTLGA